MKVDKFELAVVGGGPAGITAAVQAQRSDINVALFEQGNLGGLLHNANLVENYPSAQGKASGTELVDSFKKHLERFDIKVIFEEITDINIQENAEFELISKNNSYYSKAVILATGTVPKKIDIPGLEKVNQNRIHYEIKDLFPIAEEQKIVIIGGGDAAFDYALHLARYKCRSTILVRGEAPNCLPLLYQRVQKKPELIEVRFKIELEKIEEADVDSKLGIHYSSKEGTGKLNADCLLIAVGRTQNDYLLQKLAQKVSYSIRTEVNEKTNIPGLYLAGDIKSGSYRQVGIAVGSGLKAAMMAAEFLRGAEKE